MKGRQPDHWINLLRQVAQGTDGARLYGISDADLDEAYDSDPAFVPNALGRAWVHPVLKSIAGSEAYDALSL